MNGNILTVPSTALWKWQRKQGAPWQSCGTVKKQTVKNSTTGKDDSTKTEMRKTGSELVSRQHNPGSADSLSNDSRREFNSRQGIGYVPVEFWKKTEAVNKVKIQAMSEVQKAVAEAEQKAFEVTATERARMEQTIADVKRQAAEDAFLVINEQKSQRRTARTVAAKPLLSCH
ncbi:hypothetical protein E5288_WYG001524 [Bos mutus]|uniref:Remorin C-terminal domain-containing protein n=1 Tax=Bos mutus TaxID=72004 RepID=A0A6B0RFG3_9CETA|nr:hypothetical protein [Bos mutus]